MGRLTGTLPVAGRALPRLTGLDAGPWELGEIDVLHVNHEIGYQGSLDLIPPAVNPSIPPHVSWLAYQVPDSDLGPFRLVQTRVGCRVGLKPRGLVVGCVCDNPEVAERLTNGWGFPVRSGSVRLSRRADRIELTVEVDGAAVLELDLLGPNVLAGAGVPIAPGLNLAESPRGRQLVQVDPEYVIHSADRGTPRVRSFDAGAWGEPTIRPSWPISGTLLRAEVMLPALRFLIDPQLPPDEGTTRLP